MIYPEIVKTKARYRGPRESIKQTNMNRDVTHSLMQVQEQILSHKEKRINLAKDIMGFYNEQRYQVIRDTKTALTAVKGGELK